ncbi:MAG TPA: ferritin family protein [Anaeromyxobacteraceae bacterium]|nr:ferritin family protein [Anaeromyxobacteraceae bacterium]
MARKATKKLKARPVPGRSKPARQTAKRVLSSKSQGRKVRKRGSVPRRTSLGASAGSAGGGKPPDSARVDFASLSLRDALDLAILIEEEAQERYERLSAMVGGRYAGDAGDVFRFMAKNESLHGAELRERREALFAGEARSVGRDMLDDVEAPDWSKAGVFMSAHQALEAALESEVKAHAFFAQALPFLSEPDVKKLFQELAAEELKHQTLLRGKLRGLPPGPDLEPEMADEPGSDPG